MMNRKHILFAAALMALPAAAQETYENAKIADEDLNGTARYVGMGGAMEALGADISTMSSNPAGVGLIRHSQVSLSAGLVSQSGLPSGAQGDKTHASFDQIGFVYNIGKGQKNNFNIGFNYHKSKNFDFILAGSSKLNGASQNKLTYEKLRNGYVYNSPQNADGYYYGEFSQQPYVSANQLDAYYANNYFIGSDNMLVEGNYANATAYAMNREHTGYIGNYEVNLSGNAGSQFYWGITFGYKDVNYNHSSVYTESLETGTDAGTIDTRKIDGNGFDIKVGVIVRPVKESPFRIGAYIHTPTWYSLTTSNYTTAVDNNAQEKAGSDAYEFKLYTPWKFGLSLGHTIGNQLAIGATYEYADYSTLDSRINDGGYYDDWYGTYYETSSSDGDMNDHTKSTLKGVSTFKVGLEYKPVQNFAIRLGYNYVSPKYKEDGFKKGTVQSYGSYYASQTDYTNWKSTNRITFGLGYTLQKFTIDLAYQYSTQKGDFYPFMSYEDNVSAADDCIATGTEVKNNRSQLLLTLGYHF